jgi:hypothetical protein
VQLSFGVFLFLFLLVFIVVFAIYVSVGSAKKRKILDRLIEKKFSPSETFVSQWDYSFIALNFETKQIALGRNEVISIYDFSKIIQVDLLRDDNTITSTTKESPIARAVVGGVLLGGVGAVVGAMSAGSHSHSTNIPKSMSVRVITESGSFSVLFLRLSGTSKQNLDSLVSHFSQQAESFYGSVLKAMRMAVAVSNPPGIERSRQTIQALVASQAATLPKSAASEIEQLWHLKEKGAISADEYEKAKRSLL